MRCVAAGQFKVKDILQDVILQHLITTEILPKGVPVTHRSPRLAIRSGPEQLPD